MTPESSAALRKPFDKAVVGKLPKGGAMLDYVGHAAVTDRLLSIDPQWTWEPVAFDAAGLPALDNKGGLWIRLTVCGVTRLGYGDGPDNKQRIGDALRNAAMRFGVALDLWSKEELESGLPQPAPPPRTDRDWYARWLVRLDSARTLPEVRGLYEEIGVQVNAGACTAEDAKTLSGAAREAKQEVESGSRAVADDLAARGAERSAHPDGSADPVGRAQADLSEVLDKLAAEQREKASA